MTQPITDPLSEPRVPSYDDIRWAAELVAPWVRRTPTIDVDFHGQRVTLKLELLQHAGSFKARGAFTNVLSAPELPATLVAASGGNHGLAVAHAGHALGIETRIFVPQTAHAVKVQAIAALGAQVTQVGVTYAEALEASREAAGLPGVLALHAYDSWATVAGQGGVGLEIADQAPDVERVLVAVGGGGLVAGVANALAGAAPGASVVGVEPEACPTMRRALEHEGPVDVAVGGVASDALGASRLGEIAFATATGLATGLGIGSVLVSDDAIIEARQWLWRHLRVAAEPAGAAALAALLPGDGEAAPAGQRVCVVVCGGNADPSGLS